MKTQTLNYLNKCSYHSKEEMWSPEMVFLLHDLSSDLSDNVQVLDHEEFEKSFGERRFITAGNSFSVCLSFDLDVGGYLDKLQFDGGDVGVAVGASFNVSAGQQKDIFNYVLAWFQLVGRTQTTTNNECVSYTLDYGYFETQQRKSVRDNSDST